MRAAVLALYRFAEVPSLGRAAGVGAACGVTVLARAELGMLLPLAFLPLVVRSAGLGTPAKLARLAVAGGLAVLLAAPWTLYNLSRFTEPVLFSTNDGLTLVGANCQKVYEGSPIGFWWLPCAFEVEVPAGADQSEESKVYRDVALDFIGDHTRDLPRVVAARVGRVWGVFSPEQMVFFNTGEGRERPASWAGILSWWVVAPLSVGGALVLRRRRVALWPLLSTAVAVTVTAMLFYGITRFRVPYEVAAVVLSGVALDAALVRSRRAGEAWERSAAERERRRAEHAQPADPDGAVRDGHFPCLDAYRGLGMTMVLVIHSAFATGYDKRSPGLGKYLARLDLGLPMFFVLSAFLLYRPIVRALFDDRAATPPLRFWRRRLLRVLPGYWAALVLINFTLGCRASIPTSGS